MEELIPNELCQKRTNSKKKLFSNHSKSPCQKVRDIKEMKIAIRKLAIVMEGFQTKLDILLYTIGA
jgi:hypothetical protein